MITVTILEKDYDIINEWDEITLEDFLEVQKICDKSPKKLQKLLGHIYLGEKEEIEKMEFSDREQIKTFPKFYGDMLSVLSNIPNNILKQVDHTARQEFFNTYLIKFAIACLYAPVEPMPFEADSFEFEGETYILPKARTVMGEERPMGYASTVQYTEATDIDVYMRSLDKKDYSALAIIVSILCLKEGEEYDEDTCLKRAESFRKLPMHIVWDVFFYLDELLTTYTKAILKSSLAKVKESMREQLRHQVLTNTDGTYK